MNNQLPWERPRIKRILELFQGSKVFGIKKQTTIIRKEASTSEDRR